MSVNILLSFFYHDKTDLGALRTNLVCGRLMIDSGAFSAWTLGIPVDRLAYAEYLEGWAGRWDYAITLDVVGDPEATAANTRWLHRRGLPVLPVFTPGMKLADFDAMVADVGYVAVGGLVPLNTVARSRRVEMLQRRAQGAGGAIHALGVGALSTIRAARPYSSDSSSANAGFIFGIIRVFDGRQIKSITVSDRQQLAKHRDLIRGHGIDLADLVTSGRMPKGRAREELSTALGLTYACADEYARRRWPVPAAAAHDDSGPHLYMSMTDVLDTFAVARLDRQLHDPAATPPRVWAAYGHTHQHTRRREPA